MYGSKPVNLRHVDVDDGFGNDNDDCGNDCRMASLIAAEWQRQPFRHRRHSALRWLFFHCVLPDVSS